MEITNAEPQRSSIGSWEKARNIAVRCEAIHLYRQRSHKSSEKSLVLTFAIDQSRRTDYGAVTRC